MTYSEAKYLPICSYTTLYCRSKRLEGGLIDNTTWSCIFIISSLTLVFIAGQYWASTHGEAYIFMLSNIASLIGSTIIPEKYICTLLKKYNVRARVGGHILRLTQLTGLFTPLIIALLFIR